MPASFRLIEYRLTRWGMSVAASHTVPFDGSYQDASDRRRDLIIARQKAYASFQDVRFYSVGFPTLPATTCSVF